MLRAVCAAALASSSACAGAGVNEPSSSPVLPARSNPVAPAASGTIAEFVLAPDASSSITARTRRPRYVGKTTASLAIVVNGAGTATILNLGDPAFCDATGKCTLSIPVPAGADTFLISTYDQQGGAGRLLSRTTIAQTLPAGATTVVKAVLNGMAASLALSIGNAVATLHHTAAIPLTVTVRDADGNAIVGPGDFLYPVALKSSDTSGHWTLGAKSIAGPSGDVTLNYDGGYADTTLTATALLTQPASLAVTPAATTVRHAVPSSRTGTGIIVGPDGALWFAESAGVLGRITTAGTITDYVIPAGWYLEALCAGPDGALWFSASNGKTAAQAIVRRAPAGTYTVYPLASAYQVEGIVTASDGNMYFDQTGTLGRITPAGLVTILSVTDSLGNALHVDSIAAGADGALWFAESGYDALDRYDLTTHNVAIHPVQAESFGTPFPTEPTDIVVGSGGTLYFTTGFGVMSSTTSGSMKTLFQPESGTFGPLAIAPDGTLWFPFNVAGIQTVFGRISSGGVQTFVATTNPLPAAPFIDTLVVGPDGNLWYTQSTIVGTVTP